MKRYSGEVEFRYWMEIQELESTGLAAAELEAQQLLLRRIENDHIDVHPEVIVNLIEDEEDEV